jgi:hypothetical protein
VPSAVESGSSVRLDTYVDAVLRVDHKLLPVRIGVGAFRIGVLVHCRRASLAQETRIL